MYDIFIMGMHRTQIQLDKETLEKLRYQAFSEKRSLASVIRSILRAYATPRLQKRKPNLAEFSFVGSGRSRGKGAGNVSEHHDRQLTDAFSL